MVPIFPAPVGAELRIRQQTKKYVDEYVRPYAIENDEKAYFDRSHFERLAEERFTSLNIPSEFGGGGLSTLCYCAFLEEVSRASTALSVALGVPNLVQGAVALFGTPIQRETFLRPMTLGQLLGAFSLSEAGSGSDAASLKLSARRVDGGYLLNGTKLWCSNGRWADVLLVMARTTESKTRGITAFLVGAKTPGFRPGKEEHKMGLRASSLSELVFEQCFIPESRRLGQEGEGLKIALSQLDSGRMSIATAGLGLTVEVLHRGYRCLYERKKEGDNTEWEEQRLAELFAQAQAVRSLLRTAAEIKDQGLELTIPASQVKLLSSELAMVTSSDAVHFAGPRGTLREVELERYFRDAKALQIVEGTNQIQRKVLAREIEEILL